MVRRKQPYEDMRKKCSGRGPASQNTPWQERAWQSSQVGRMFGWRRVDQERRKGGAIRARQDPDPAGPPKPWKTGFYANCHRNSLGREEAWSHSGSMQIIQASVYRLDHRQEEKKQGGQTSGYCEGPDNRRWRLLLGCWRWRRCYLLDVHRNPRCRA